MADDEPAFEAVTVAGGVARAVVRHAHARRLCAGHFPGEPIVPGSALTGLMADVGARLVPEPLREIVRCTFRTPVVPEDDIVIAATRGPGEQVEVEVVTARGRAARALLRFGTRA